MTKAHWRVLTIRRASDMSVSIRYHEMTNQLTGKVGFEWTPKLDPYWKWQTWSGKQNWICEQRQFSLVGSEFLIAWTTWVTDLIDKEHDDNEQETSTTKTEVFAFASRSKAKTKLRRPSTTCSSSRTILILERTWIDIDPGAQFDQAYPVAKINTLLRHGELPRDEDGAIEFWRLKMIFGTNMCSLNTIPPETNSNDFGGFGN